MLLWVMALVVKPVGAAGALAGAARVLALICAELESSQPLVATTCMVYSVSALKPVKTWFAYLLTAVHAPLVPNRTL